MVSGNSDIGFLAKDDWNPEFKNTVFRYPLPRPGPFLIPRNERCMNMLLFQPYREQSAILDAEGDWENESDDSDVDIYEFKSYRDSDSGSITSSTKAELGSPMLVDKRE